MLRNLIRAGLLVGVASLLVLTACHPDDGYVRSYSGSSYHTQSSTSGRVYVALVDEVQVAAMDALKARGFTITNSLSDSEHGEIMAMHHGTSIVITSMHLPEMPQRTEVIVRVHGVRPIVSASELQSAIAARL